MKESENKIVFVAFRMDRQMFYKITKYIPEDMNLSEFIRQILFEKIGVLEEEERNTFLLEKEKSFNAQKKKD